MKEKILIVFMFFSLAVLGQSDSSANKGRIKKGFGVTVTQVQPQFPGGQDSLEVFLKNNLAYPESAKINRVQGRVYIGFLVDRTGKIKNERILSSATEDLDKEAIRVVKLMPDWQPGTAGGSPVDVQYILPIDFIMPPAKPE